MTRPALDYPRPGLLPAPPCDHCRTTWGATERRSPVPRRTRGLCYACYQRLRRQAANPTGLGTRPERAPFPPVKAWRWRLVDSDPTPDEIAAICLEIRTAMANQGHPKVPTGCTLTLHQPHRTEPHIYRAPRAKG